MLYNIVVSEEWYEFLEQEVSISENGECIVPHVGKVIVHKAPMPTTDYTTKDKRNTMKEMNDQEVECAIGRRGLTAPRLTPRAIAETIVKAEFHQLTDVLTVCVLTLRNGFTVTGESACASPENYDKEIGEGIALKNAKDKIWMLEGYLLKQRLFDAQ